VWHNIILQDLAGSVDSSLVISEMVVGLNAVGGGTSLGMMTGGRGCCISECTNVDNLVDE